MKSIYKVLLLLPLAFLSLSASAGGLKFQGEFGKFAYTVPNIQWENDYGSFTKSHESFDDADSVAFRVVKPIGNWEFGAGIRSASATAKSYASEEMQAAIDAMHEEAAAEGTTDERKADLYAELDNISRAHTKDYDETGASLSGMYYTQGKWQYGAGAELFIGEKTTVVPKLGLRTRVGSNTTLGAELGKKGHFTTFSLVGTF